MVFLKGQRESCLQHSFVVAGSQTQTLQRVQTDLLKMGLFPNEDQNFRKLLRAVSGVNQQVEKLTVLT